MAVSYHSFCALSSVEQYAAVWHEGTFLMRRYAQEDAVNLYQMRGGYFAEVFYDQFTNHLRTVEVFSYCNSERLENYESYIQLDELPL